ncbi:hypothetical protein ANO11243_019410 [Dothideomycetidae sp. 11243]|nr:hypothetical protein ANO11243_019410 [fungal sp. No.11243]
MAAPANPASTAAELKHHFTTSNACCVIAPESLQDHVLEAADGLGIREVIVTEDLESAMIHPEFRTRSQAQSHNWSDFDNADKARKRIACLNSTSGTTGLPKLAARSHYSLVMEHVAIEEATDSSLRERRLLCTPFFHAFTSPLGVIGALRTGVETYVMRRFDARRFIDCVKQHQITEAAMVPPMIAQFLAMDPASRQPLKNLRRVWVGGAPLDGTTQTRAASMFANEVNISQVWGMTEGGWMTTFETAERDFSGSVGRLLGHFDGLRIVNVDHDAASNYGLHSTSSSSQMRYGEIWVRGPSNMLGYLNNPEATAATMTSDGWLRTGDVGGCAPDGRIFLVDRLKELIKVRGWQVAPAEVEAVLLAHEKIVDAGVIGVYNKAELTELPLAYVVLRQGCRMCQEEVKDHLFESLAKHKIRDIQVKFVDTIPKSISGKILRKVLREWAAEEKENEY